MNKHKLGQLGTEMVKAARNHQNSYIEDNLEHLHPDHLTELAYAFANTTLINDASPVKAVKDDDGYIWMWHNDTPLLNVTPVEEATIQFIRLAAFDPTAATEQFDYLYTVNPQACYETIVKLILWTAGRV